MYICLMTKMAASNPKLREADEQVAEAKKCLKTSLFKWSPDYEGAAYAYNKAGLAYKNGRSYEKAKECFLQAADCYAQRESAFHSAKALEDAGSVCKDMKDLEEAVTLWERASERYCLSDAASTGCIVLENAGKLLETSNPLRSAQLFIKLANLYEQEGKTGEQTKAKRKAGNTFLKAGQVEEALESYSEYRRLSEQRGGELMVHQAVATQALLLVRLGRTRDAKRTLREASMIMPTFGDSKEAAVMEGILDAMLNQDSEELTRLCNDHVIKSLDTSVVKLARELPKNAVENTNLLDDEDQQLLEDEDETALEEEGQRLVAMMRSQPHTKEDDVRDELFSTSRSRAVARDEDKRPSPPPTTTTGYRPSEEVKNVMDEEPKGVQPEDVQVGESGKGEELEEGQEEEEEGEGEGLDIN